MFLLYFLVCFLFNGFFNLVCVGFQCVGLFINLITNNWLLVDLFFFVVACMVYQTLPSVCCQCIVSFVFLMINLITIRWLFSFFCCFIATIIVYLTLLELVKLFIVSTITKKYRSHCGVGLEIGNGEGGEDDSKRQNKDEKDKSSNCDEMQKTQRRQTFYVSIREVPKLIK